MHAGLSRDLGDHGLWTVGDGLWTVDCGRWTVGGGSFFWKDLICWDVGIAIAIEGCVKTDRLQYKDYGCGNGWWDIGTIGLRICRMVDILVSKDWEGIDA